MPVVSVVLAGLMMQSRGAIRLGMRIACRRTPTAIGFGGYSLWTPDSRECGYSVRIQCVRLHDRAIRTRGSPGPDKLESVCTGCECSGLHKNRCFKVDLSVDLRSTDLRRSIDLEQFQRYECQSLPTCPHIQTGTLLHTSMQLYTAVFL